MLPILRRSWAGLLVAIIVVLLVIPVGAQAAENGADAGGKPAVTGAGTSGSGAGSASSDTATGKSEAGAPEGTIPVDTTGATAETTGTTGNVPADTSTDAEEPIAPLQKIPLPGQDPTPHKAPVSTGKPQIGLLFPAHRQLAALLRITEPAARARIKSAEALAQKRLAAAGMDPNINIDDAMALGRPVINIHCKKSVGDNILGRGFCLQAALCQYQRKPSGRIDTARYFRIGESPEVYSGADFEDKALMLVDAYISAVKHQAAAAKQAKPPVKGKKTK